jgi:hypothetical protein
MDQRSNECHNCGGPTWKADKAVRPKCWYCKAPIKPEQLRPQFYAELINECRGLFNIYDHTTYYPELNVRITNG